MVGFSVYHGGVHATAGGGGGGGRCNPDCDVGSSGGGRCGWWHARVAFKFSSDDGVDSLNTANILKVSEVPTVWCIAVGGSTQISGVELSERVCG